MSTTKPRIGSVIATFACSALMVWIIPLSIVSHARSQATLQSIVLNSARQIYRLA